MPMTAKERADLGKGAVPAVAKAKIRPVVCSVDGCENEWKFDGEGSIVAQRAAGWRYRSQSLAVPDGDGGRVFAGHSFFTICPKHVDEGDW